MNEKTLSVPEIHCDHCKMSIEGAVAALPGVEHATVDIANATVSVAFDDPATIEDIVGAIESQGYDVSAQA
ncbi:MAG: cation transporter [Acidimicrobiia bacterium]